MTVERKPAVVKIKGVEYDLKFTIGFWKKMKEVADVTAGNLEKRVEEDFSTVASNMIHYGILYGNNSGKEVPSVEAIEQELSRDVLDVIEQAIINGMTKAEFRLVELARKNQEVKWDEAEQKVDELLKKKESQLTSTDSKSNAV